MFIKKYFTDHSPLSEKEYGRARFGFILGDASFTCMSTFVIGIYFTPLLLTLGLDSATISVIANLPTLAGFLRLFSPYIASKLKYRKTVILFGILLYCLPYIPLYFLPLFGAGPSVYLIVGLTVFIANAANALVASLYSEFLMSVAFHGEAAGKFFGRKSGIQNLLSILPYLAGAYVTARFTGENEKIAFLLLGLGGIVTAIPRIVGFIMAREPLIPAPERTESPLRISLNIIRSKEYRPYLIHTLILAASTSWVGGIDGVFNIRYLGLSLPFISFVSIGYMICSVPASLVLGKLCDKIGAKRTLFLSQFAFAFCYLINVFGNVDNGVAVRIATQTISVFALNGAAVSETPFMYSCTDTKNRLSFISYQPVLAMAVSYPISLISSLFIKIFDRRVLFSVGGWNFEIAHVLYLVCGCVILADAAYLFALMHKQK